MFSSSEFDRLINPTYQANNQDNNQSNILANRIEKSWTTRSGYNAICYANRGYRCGYVEIPINEIDMLDVNDPMDYNSYEIECHGYLTFCGNAHWDKNNNNIWIGFDCTHYGDLFDSSLVSSLEYEILVDEHYNIGTIKTLEFVMNECEKIGEQLIQLLKES